jgi:hypothetical protein
MSTHLPAVDHGFMDPSAALYAIRIRGHLGAMVIMAFPAMATQWHGPDTILTGVLDRSALFGVLAEVETLGLELLEIRQISPHDQQSESGGRCPP